MESIILDPLPFRVEPAAIRQALRVRDGTNAARELDQLLDEAGAIARPRALYRLSFITERGPDFVEAEGRRFSSRILAVNLNGLHRFFAYVCTSGAELAAWAEAKEDLWTKFAADVVNEAVLKAAVEALAEHLTATYGVSGLSAMNPGSLADWPMREQLPLFDLLGDVEAATGVQLRESFLMTPIKSVSGVFFPSEETFASCQLCPRPSCPNRRAPYDSAMFARRYARD